VKKQVQLARYLIGKIPSVAQFWKLDGKMVKEIVEEEYKAAYHCSPCDKDLRKRGKCKEGKMNFQYPL